ncbi:hypothetical protein [Telluria aromaticivorans]|uniref:Uncharacterized protein n=1 Tax=Telluria aromaticivorans TaxID=2725995 RepID=A0A7Y2JX61_9BURK|nr:hypothetical protein [Telluria aromaticivorans]NNG22652.1 hypothetical protein [Telluria aromaticivorans]
MDDMIDSRIDTYRQALVDIGVALRRDCGSAYARGFLEDVKTSEAVIARILLPGAVRPCCELQCGDLVEPVSVGDPSIQ